MKAYQRISALLIGGLCALAMGAALLAETSYDIIGMIMVLIAGIACGTLGVIRLIGAFMVFTGATIATVELVTMPGNYLLSTPMVMLVVAIMVGSGSYAIIAETKHKLSAE